MSASQFWPKADERNRSATEIYDYRKVRTEIGLTRAFWQPGQLPRCGHQPGIHRIPHPLLRGPWRRDREGSGAAGGRVRGAGSRVGLAGQPAILLRKRPGSTPCRSPASIRPNCWSGCPCRSRGQPRSAHCPEQWRSATRCVYDALYATSIAAVRLARRHRKPVILIQHIAALPFRSAPLRGLMALANSLVTTRMLRAAT